MYANDDILLVAARSDVFSAMFEHEMEERKHVSTQIMCCIYAHFLRFNIINLRLVEPFVTDRDIEQALLCSVWLCVRHIHGICS